MVFGGDVRADPWTDLGRLAILSMGKRLSVDEVALAGSIYLWLFPGVTDRQVPAVSLSGHNAMLLGINQP
jgi:hypothetical protein